MRKTTKDYYQIGEVSKILEVAPHTVARWYDMGKLTGYRLPATSRQGEEGTRRIHRDSLRSFMEANKIVVPPELRREKTLLLVSDDNTIGRALVGTVGAEAGEDMRLRSAGDFWGAAEIYHADKPACVIFDARLGRPECLAALRSIRDRGDCVCLLGIANEDDDRLGDWGMDAADVFKRPFDPSELIERVRGLFVPGMAKANGKKAKAS